MQAYLTRDYDYNITNKCITVYHQSDNVLKNSAINKWTNQRYMRFHK